MQIANCRSCIIVATTGVYILYCTRNAYTACHVLSIPVHAPFAINDPICQSERQSAKAQTTCFRPRPPHLNTTTMSSTYRNLHKRC